MNQPDETPEPPKREDWRFIAELQQYLPPRFYWNRAKKAAENELDLSSGVEYHAAGNEDQRKLLASASDDLERFLQHAGIFKHNGIPIYTEIGSNRNYIYDSFEIVVGDDRLKLAAGNAEGIRRAIYYLEDLLLQASGPFLRKCVIRRTAWLKNRISRCFFGPIKRPPYNHDELLDNIDYYPEEYLNRLAHEGVNGLWLSASFRDLCCTSLTELSPDAAIRLKKLQKTVDKCRRYGIKIWLLTIEPASFPLDDPFLQEHPELQGALSEDGDRRCFCPCSEKAQKYLYQTTNYLFNKVSGLGGVINISHGERLTTCLSSVSSISDAPVECPRCRSIPKGEILGRCLSAMQKGMTDANPECELICWLYTPTPLKRSEWIFEIAGYLPENIILQYNFESNGMMNQLGKPRTGGDYWLSYVGPSNDFIRQAEKVRQAGLHLSAKLQVGCSHEVASVPFVPVPGLLYRKYREMYKYGCSTVMQCWYFGNYPGIMNRAAGWLAFTDFKNAENVFLNELAAGEWGAYATEAVGAWEKMAEAYSCFPFSNEFQYYGPIGDGVVWPLYLRPVIKALSPAWKPETPPSGDVIGECLKGFTLPEVLSLCDDMEKQWRQGVEILKDLLPHFQDNRERLKDIGLAEALGVMFKSGRNILAFYYLRHLLFNGRENDKPGIIEKMISIIKEEVCNSRRMLELSENDSRLGFHSEAENYKYYPAKLKWRINQLNELLSGDVKDFSKIIEHGQTPSWISNSKIEYDCGSGWLCCDNFKWRIDKCSDGLLVHAECKALSSILIVTLIDRTGIMFPWCFRCNSDSSLYNFSWGNIDSEIISDDSWRLTLTLSSLSWNMDEALRPAYFSFIYINPESKSTQKYEIWPQPQGIVERRLAFGYYTPDNTAILNIDDITAESNTKNSTKENKIVHESLYAN